MTRSLKDRLFHEVLPALGREAAYFSFARIKAAVAARRLGIGDASLRVYLNEALRKGVVHDAGRGWYARLHEPVPLDAKPMAKLARAVGQVLPLLDFAGWSTAQVGPWLHHLLARPVLFLYAPGDALDSVGETLAARGWSVAVDPAAAEASRLVRPGPRMVVLRPQRSKQPAGDGHQAPIEKILVDLIEEADETALMDGAEAQGVVQTLLGRYRLSVAALQSYAGRRGVKIKALAAIN